MRTTLILVSFASVVFGGSVSLETGDLSSGSKGLDNIKAKWSQTLKVLNHDATVTASYDRNENQNFPNEATLTGSSGNIGYEVRSGFGRTVDYTLSTKTDDGSSIQVEGSADLINARDFNVQKVSATSARKLRDNDFDIEMSHDLNDNESKLKMSTVLGAGVKAIGTLANKAGAASTGYEIEYETQLTSGRRLSATVSPADGAGEIEYEDSASLDGTITATIPLGEAPKVTFKRSFGF